MRLRNERLRTGHLLLFASPEDKRENFSIFIMVEDLSQFEAVLKITEGLQRIFESLEDNRGFETYSIADVGNVHATVPDIDEGRMLRFEPEELLLASGQMNEAMARTILKRLVQGTASFSHGSERAEWPQGPISTTGPKK
jgi:hypothetical protein